MIIVKGQPHLLHVVQAGCSRGCAADFLHGRKKEPQQGADDTDDYDEFDEAKAIPWLSHRRGSNGWLPIMAERHRTAKPICHYGASSIRTGIASCSSPPSHLASSRTVPAIDRALPSHRITTV